MSSKVSPLFFTSSTVLGVDGSVEPPPEFPPIIPSMYDVASFINSPSDASALAW